MEEIGEVLCARPVCFGLLLGAAAAGWPVQGPGSGHEANATGAVPICAGLFVPAGR